MDYTNLFGAHPTIAGKKKSRKKEVCHVVATMVGDDWVGYKKRVQPRMHPSTFLYLILL